MSMETVYRIQDDLGVVVEELLAIRARLRALQAETQATPSYKLAQRSDGAPPTEEEETVGFHLDGALSEGLDRLDSLALGLLEAKELLLGEADYALLAP